MAKKLYVGNLSFSMTNEELEAVFSEFGTVTSASVVMDRYTNKSRGFGFVEFAEDADAIKAKEAVDGKEFGGRALRVDEAKEPRERDSRDSRDSRGDRGDRDSSSSRGYGSTRSFSSNRGSRY
jgi:RNA recognition motif-containing protein